MKVRLASKPLIPKARTTDSIATEIEEGLAKLLSGEVRLSSPHNQALSKKAKDVGFQPDLLEEYRRKLRDIKAVL